MARIRFLTALGLAATLAFAAAAEAGTATTRTVVKTERVYLQLSGMG